MPGGRGVFRMNFNSVTFLGFLIITVLVYYLLPQKGRNVWLLLCSYYFYMCWNVTYSLLMLSTTLISYFMAILLEYFRGGAKTKVPAGCGCSDSGGDAVYL